MPPEKRISVRVSPEFKQRLNDAVEITGLTEPQLVKQALAAIMEEIERTGKITVPVKIASEDLKKGVRPPYSQDDRERLKVAEGS